MRVNISKKTSVDDTVKVIRGEDVPGDSDRNRLRASGFIAQACERKDLVIDGGHKIIRKTLPTPGVTAL
jgi:hypothetical protein